LQHRLQFCSRFELQHRSFGELNVPAKIVRVENGLEAPSANHLFAKRIMNRIRKESACTITFSGNSQRPCTAVFDAKSAVSEYFTDDPTAAAKRDRA
jgi:hypothetical protein